MENYCCWTGQIINNNKSSLIFSRNTCRRRKKRISMLLGIKETKDLYYLEIKLTQRRRSATDFLHILEKATNKLSVWGKKFISTAGRITLIKSVIQALPVYYSTLSLVPISVLKKLVKMCRDFLWNKGDGNNGLHYVAWKDLCKPLKLGGMGIQSAVESVEPLRAKLVWKFYNEPNSLLSKSIYAKHGNQFLHSVRSHNSSPTWKLYLSGAKALKHIVKWNIMDGVSINIMKDIWLLDRKLECWPTFISNDIDNISNLSNFITEGTWNAEELKKYFGFDLVNLICNQKIDNDIHEDKLELLNSHSGFTLSALIKNANSEKMEIDLHWINGWSCLKKLKLNPRVHHFWWRLQKNALPTRDFLNQRKLVDGNLCPRVCCLVEDANHIATNCFRLNLLINKANSWGFEIPSFLNLNVVISFLKDKSFNKSFIKNLYCSLVFTSWKSRNTLIHEGKEMDDGFIVTNAITYASTSFSYIHSNHWNANQQMLTPYSWHPPPPGWIKINIDAALHCSKNAGIGGILRDHRGRMLLAYGFSLVHWDIRKLEWLAVRSIGNIIEDWKLKSKGIIVEGDNYNVMKHFKNLSNLDKRRLNKSSKEDFDFLNNFEVILFKYVSINCNKVAHWCANHAFNGNFTWDTLEVKKVPPTFFSLLKEESDRSSIT
ncbi:Putative ribonuclease H protein [Dendrobium catenatum]|uniref:Ribonuclease H protein n=1 Tax=Dendrobium catenatum TaxID=906689 RepID=A0A2I0VXU0_9ASPA|nr:Putative ribonuclease H protein [Dendrobium catenatum]